MAKKHHKTRALKNPGPKGRLEHKDTASDLSSSSNKSDTKIHTSRLRTMVAALLAVAAIGGITKINENEPDEKPKNKAIPTLRIPVRENTAHNQESQTKTSEIETIQKYWSVINKIEDGLPDFVTNINFSVISNPELRTDLEKVIESIEKNKKTNPHRNAAETVNKRVSFPIEGFVYNIMDMKKSTGVVNIAAFSLKLRWMSISSDFDPNDPIDWIAFMHETLHASYDAKFKILHRKGVFPEYETLFNTEGIFINEEVKTFAFHIELLNALLNNTLRTKIEDGKDLNDENELNAIAETLGLEKSNHSSRSKLILKSILKSATTYYKTGGIKNGSVSEEFVEEVLSNYPGYQIIAVKNGEISILEKDDARNASKYGQKIDYKP